MSISLLNIYLRWKAQVESPERDQDLTENAYDDDDDDDDVDDEDDDDDDFSHIGHIFR